jgi:hypothetical protein
VITLIWTAAILLAVIACLVLLAVIVVNVHRVDRAKSLKDSPRGYADTMTRRIIGVHAFNLHRSGRHS